MKVVEAEGEILLFVTQDESYRVQVIIRDTCGRCGRVWQVKKTGRAVNDLCAKCNAYDRVKKSRMKIATLKKRRVGL